MDDETFRLVRYQGVDSDGTVRLDTGEEGLSVADLVIGKKAVAGDVVVLVNQGVNIFVCGVTPIET